MEVRGGGSVKWRTGKILVSWMGLRGRTGVRRSQKQIQKRPIHLGLACVINYYRTCVNDVEQFYDFTSKIPIENGKPRLRPFYSLISKERRFRGIDPQLIFSQYPDTLFTVILKIVQLVVACAIFNPFCCCTAGVLTVDDVTEAPVAHSCCQSQSSELPAEGDSKQEHDMAECPHAALKDYEVANQKDVTAAYGNGTLLPALLVVCELLAIEPRTQTQLPVRWSTASPAPPLSFVQVYCIYRV